MNQRNGVQSKPNQVQTYEKVLLGGQILTIAGGALLALGKTLHLLQTSQIPSTPIVDANKQTSTTSTTDTLYSGRRSYFTD
jgi:hypothetical protein